MNRRRNIIVAFCLLAMLAICGAFAGIGCNCHDDEDCHSEAACACDCVCCGSGSAVAIAASGADCITPLEAVGFLHPVEAVDSGRLTESFIFTPPRA